MRIVARMVGAVAGCAALSLGVGAVSAAPTVDMFPWPLPVFGGEQAQPDRELARTTADGWVVHARKSGEIVHLAPPLDGAATTGEAFGTLSAQAWIDGHGSPELTGALFEAGYQIGCGVDVSGGADVTVAGTLGIAPRGGVGVEGGPSVGGGLEGGPSVTVTMPGGSGTVGGDATAKAEVGADATAKAEAGVDAKAEISPTMSMHLDPGAITNVPLVSMPIDPTLKRAAGGFTGAHLQINGCAGPVSMRSYVMVSTTSPTSVDAVSVYGDARRIR